MSSSAAKDEGLALPFTFTPAEVAALERIAVRDGRSVDSVLARELRDLVSAQSHWLAKEIPGFAEALSWPESLRGPA